MPRQTIIGVLRDALAGMVAYGIAGRPSVLREALQEHAGRRRA